MKRPGLWCGLLAVASLCTAPATVSAESMDATKAFTKLTRGAVNIVTGWVEIPNRIHETVQMSGPAAGFTWGLLRGLGYGAVRTVAGVYELLTFPFPAPPGYESVIQPEYIFSSQATGASLHSYHK